VPLDVGEIVLADLSYSPRPGLGLSPFLGLALFLGKQINSLLGRVGDVTGALAGVGKAQSRVGAEYRGPLRLVPRALTEKPISQAVWIFGARRIDPKTQTGRSGVRHDEAAACQRLSGADKAVGELGFHIVGVLWPFARYSPGTQKPAARGRIGANGHDEYMALSQWKTMSFHQRLRMVANVSE